MPKGIYEHRPNQGFQKGNTYKGFLGKHHTEKSNLKNKLAHLDKPSPNKGKKLSYVTERNLKDNPAKRLEVREKIGKAHKGKHFSPQTEFKKGQFSKELHPNWQGGGDKRTYVGHYWYTVLRPKILQRDNWTCKRCGIKIEKSFDATVDHIIPFRYSKDNSESNLQTLCRKCNIAKEKEDKIKYFNSLKIKEAVEEEEIVK